MLLVAEKHMVEGEVSDVRNRRSSKHTECSGGRGFKPRSPRNFAYLVSVESLRCGPQNVQSRFAPITVVSEIRVF